MYNSPKICVIGGGAAGLMAAGTAVSYGADVTIFEHMKMLGKKLAITGKGRCNVTNNTDVPTFLNNVTRNSRFLYSSLNNLSPSDTIAMFENLGVKLKTERGNRVFPESDKARDIVNALIKYSHGAKIIHEKIKSVTATDNGFTVIGSKEYTFDKVIIATGGKSYPLTGSDGSGYMLARKLGHDVTELTPSLIPICSSSAICAELQGLSLKNVNIRVLNSNKKCLYEDFGEMLFTHFGVTGPIILSASAHLKDEDISNLMLSIDLKPALDIAALDARLLSDFKANTNRDFINSLSALLPNKMIEPFVFVTGIDPRKKVHNLTREERSKIINTLKNFEIPLSHYRPIDEAIITSGGINVKEISPKTMESKLISGLYFAGEIIDVDAYTGGFNLQIAFSTGFTAGKSAANSNY